jgi:hypothetical protein
MMDLAATIANTPCDVVVVATPIDLKRVVNIDKLNTRFDNLTLPVGNATFITQAVGGAWPDSSLYERMKAL